MVGENVQLREAYEGDQVLICQTAKRTAGVAVQSDQSGVIPGKDKQVAGFITVRFRQSLGWHPASGGGCEVG